MPSNQLIPPGIAYLADNIISRQNILGASRQSRAKWAKGLSFSNSNETIFFAGCGYQFTDRLERLSALMRKLDAGIVGTDLPVKLAGLQKKLGFDGLYQKLVSIGDGSGGGPLRDAVRVLQQLGIEFGYLGEEEPCCGGLLYFAGLHREFALNAQRLAERLKSDGVRRIIGIVPSCTYTLRELVPQFASGFDIEVRHFTEVVLDAVRPGCLSHAGAMKVTYHDPCQMARYLGLVSQPRDILRQVKGLTLVEPEFTSGKMATCCGGGGGFEAVFPELSEILATNRARELADTGAEAIVTQCPGCIMQLEAGLRELKKDNIRVLDLAQVLAAAIGV